MAERVVFYQLTHKFVNQDQAIPEEARQVIYYSLAIGHHVGVLDCFQPLMDVPLEAYRAWLEGLPEGEGRRKLAGVLAWGEIEINRGHARDLAPLVAESLACGAAAWVGTLNECLRMMIEEPAFYVMVRRMA